MVCSNELNKEDILITGSITNSPNFQPNEEDKEYK